MQTKAFFGIDIKNLQKYPGIFLHGSILETPTETFLEHLGGQADLVISDMAPNTTGTRLTDHVRQIQLEGRISEELLLAPNGRQYHQVLALVVLNHSQVHPFFCRTRHSIFPLVLFQLNRKP